MAARLWALANGVGMGFLHTMVLPLPLLWAYEACTRRPWSRQAAAIELAPRAAGLSLISCVTLGVQSCSLPGAGSLPRAEPA
jgi:hypothetical protein